MIFLGHGLEAKFRGERLARHGLVEPALIDSIRQGETVDDVKRRLDAGGPERNLGQ